LEKELRYTKAALGEDASSTTHQLLIQTPRTPEASVLQPSALLAHLDVVRAASAVSVHMFDMLVIASYTAERFFENYNFLAVRGG
jgi:patched 1